jgi:glycosyltransferase involved in cell wall biosynthesis
MVVDVRDIWPAAAEALGELSNRRVLSAFEGAEKWMYKRSARVTATTKPFCRHIDRIAGWPVSVHLPNGALDELVALPDEPRVRGPDFVLGYAGNLGIAQGLGIVLDAAEHLRGEPVRLVMVGEGPLSAQLREEVRARRLENVELRQGIPVTQVASFLRSCDALLVPLRDHDAFTDFIPSKLYDAMAVGRPVIVAARGEAPALLEESGAGLVVDPEDGPALAAAIRQLGADDEQCETMGAAGRRAAAALTRSRQVERLEAVLVEAGAEQR